MDRSYSKFVAVVDLVLENAVDDDVVVVVVVDSEIDDAFKTKKKWYHTVKWEREFLPTTWLLFRQSNVFDLGSSKAVRLDRILCQKSWIVLLLNALFFHLSKRPSFNPPFYIPNDYSNTQYHVYTDARWLRLMMS